MVKGGRRRDSAREECDEDRPREQQRKDLKNLTQQLVWLLEQRKGCGVGSNCCRASSSTKKLHPGRPCGQWARHSAELAGDRSSSIASPQRHQPQRAGPRANCRTGMRAILSLALRGFVQGSRALSRQVGGSAWEPTAATALRCVGGGWTCGLACGLAYRWCASAPPPDAERASRRTSTFACLTSPGHPPVPAALPQVNAL